ncbi:MAG: RdgB/HAM1 family non-canonical purine NTP pyrophosphatase [Nitrospirae bacterium]|nr:RdgB/HAM1 family non-canonical purine NTP pyrophosphatase [Magnetococcales bacterium]
MLPLEIVLATRNPKKVEELRRMFVGNEIIFLDLNAFPGSPEVEENGSTFEENADLKSRAIAGYTQRHALADDSGLVVDALDGAPGVRSARFAGPGATDAQNLHWLLATLKEKGGVGHRARFECALSLCDPWGQIERFSGVVHGVIVGEPRGANGFGYDPVFVPDGERLTFAQMSAGEKDRISHRGRALEALAKRLSKRLPKGLI